MELAQVPAMGMGVVQHGKLIWQHYAGISDLQTKAPVNAKTLWVAASLSKQPFGYGALRLADQEKLDLDRPVYQYLDRELPSGEFAKRITARHILTHSSGLPGWRQTRELTSDFEPGTRFRYSGEGFYLLSRCVEQIAGVGFEQFMQERVFVPLGMPSSTYLWRPDAGVRMVTGYRGDDPFTNKDFAEKLFKQISESGVPLAKWNHDRIEQLLAPKNGENQGFMLPADILYPNAAFSLLTTVEDYSQLMIRITTRRNDGLDLQPSTINSIMRPYSRVNSALSWGLGWGIEDEDGIAYLWQWGNNAGAWTNFLLIHPRTESGIVVFSNGANGNKVTERLLRAATGHDNPAFLWI